MTDTMAIPCSEAVRQLWDYLDHAIGGLAPLVDVDTRPECAEGLQQGLLNQVLSAVADQPPRERVEGGQLREDELLEGLLRAISDACLAHVDDGSRMHVSDSSRRRSPGLYCSDPELQSDPFGCRLGR